MNPTNQWQWPNNLPLDRLLPTFTFTSLIMVGDVEVSWFLEGFRLLLQQTNSEYEVFDGEVLLVVIAP